MKNCQVCGRPLRTGRKYCYTCKKIGIRKVWNKEKIFFMAVTGTIFLICSWFSEDEFIDLLGFMGLIVGFPLLLIFFIRFLIKRKNRKNKINLSE